MALKSCGVLGFNCRFSLLRALINPQSGRYNFVVSRTNASTAKKEDEEKDAIESEETSLEEEEETYDEEIFQQELAELRDFSGLPEQHKNKMYHREQIPEVNGPFQLTRIYKKQLFHRMGRKSEVDPSLFYPFQDELDEMIEERKLFEPSLDELIASAQAKVDEEERAIREKQELVERNMAKMPQWIEEFREKVRRKEEEDVARVKKAKALVDEAREFYGYDIDRNDPRFEQMVLMKEEEEKLAKKQKKKEKKSALASLVMQQEKAKREREAAAQQAKEESEKGAAPPQEEEAESSKQV